MHIKGSLLKAIVEAIDWAMWALAIELEEAEKEVVSRPMALRAVEKLKNCKKELEKL